MLRNLLLVQGRPWIQVGDFLAGPVRVMVTVVMVSVVVAVVAVVVVVVSCVCLLDGRPHAELGEPVHGGQAALQLGGHGALEDEGSEGKVEWLSDVACAGSPVWLTEWVLCSSLGSSLKKQEKQEVYLLRLFISFSQKKKHIWQRHTNNNLNIVFHMQYSCVS